MPGRPPRRIKEAVTPRSNRHPSRRAVTRLRIGAGKVRDPERPVDAPGRDPGAAHHDCRLPSPAPGQLLTVPSHPGRRVIMWPVRPEATSPSCTGGPVSGCAPTSWTRPPRAAMRRRSTISWRDSGRHPTRPATRSLFRPSLPSPGWREMAPGQNRLVPRSRPATGWMPRNWRPCSAGGWTA